MNQSRIEHPRARQTDVLVEHAGDETIVYDRSRHEAHSLNRTAAVVWRHCDGTRSVPQLALLLGAELGIAADETVVRYALDHLAQANLLEGIGGASEPPVTRRAVMKKLVAAGAMIAIPTVVSIVAPTPAMAASVIDPPDPGGDH